MCLLYTVCNYLFLSFLRIYENLSYGSDSCMSQNERNRKATPQHTHKHTGHPQAQPHTTQEMFWVLGFSVAWARVDHLRYLRSLRRRRRRPGPEECGHSCPSGLSRLLPQPETGPLSCGLSDKPSLMLTDPLCPEKKGRHLEEKSNDRT